jgi:DNA modification methylase
LDLDKIYHGDSLELIQQLPDNSIDLLVTSPPYADIKSYGQGVHVFHPDNYAGWLLQYNSHIHRVLKPTGSCIINVNDKIVNKLRHPYVFDYIVRSKDYSDLKLYDLYIWHKVSGLPNGSPKRLNNNIEYIIHFVKDPDKVKWNMDSVREPYKDSALSRIKTPILSYETDINGKKTSTGGKIRKLNPAGGAPSRVLRFQTNQISRGNKHPAPYSLELPTWFIKALTDKGDVVLDPFMGSGTTAEAALLLGRKFIGFEINEAYIKDAYDRIRQLLMREKYF